MGSETTAAATGAVGVLRRDSMAMKPFCGYNFADYFSHWLSFDKPGAKLPKIFHVNWFRKDADGKFMWPGYGENLRVLEWIIRRVEGTARGIDTPIGTLPAPGGINLEGLALGQATERALFEVDTEAWATEMKDIASYLDGFGERLPRALGDEQRRMAAALANTAPRAWAQAV
jgi:phosphoenolpyruvate carboxykinase (GTP)